MLAMSASFFSPLRHLVDSEAGVQTSLSPDAGVPVSESCIRVEASSPQRPFTRVMPSNPTRCSGELLSSWEFGPDDGR